MCYGGRSHVWFHMANIEADSADENTVNQPLNLRDT